jgi:UDP-3-O-[3-hydroxymyristoyl] glucosamine N-acyltransferase
MAHTVEALATICGGVAEGDTQRVITGVAVPEAAAASEIIFADSERSLEAALAGNAGCVVVSEKAATHGRTIIRARNPKLAFARIVSTFHPVAHPPAGRHPTAVVDWTTKIGEGASVGALAVIGAHVLIGARTTIGAGCVIGDNTIIGDDCVLYARVAVYPNARIGSRVILHSGAVIGSDGFGYVFDSGHYEKFPQVGRVEIADDVEIGANTTVDRAALGVTSIGRGTKIDNLVQVGHNVRIGEHCAIASLTGISGSSEIGDYVVIAGQVGIGDHARVASCAR